MVIKLDNIEILETPDGIDDISFFLERNEGDITAFIEGVDLKLSFSKDGYDLIVNKFYQRTDCSAIEIEIYNTPLRIFKGVIRKDQITLNDCISVDVAMTDDSFYQRIFNNKDLDVNVFGQLSKNKTDISAFIPGLYKSQFFNPANGSLFNVHTGVGQERASTVYRTYDILKYFVAYLSDDNLLFDSNLLGIGGPLQYHTITTGRVIQTVQTSTSEEDFMENIPLLKLSDVLKGINSKFPIVLFVDYSGQKPIVRVESETDSYSNVASAVEFRNIADIEITYGEKQSYSTVLIGDDCDYNGGTLLRKYDKLGFGKAQFALNGNCGNGSELKMVSEALIHNTNCIEDALINQVPDYNDKWFVISGYASLTGGRIDPTATNWINPFTAERFYNELFSNENTAQRVFRGKATLQAVYKGSGQGFDPNNNYGWGTPQGKAVTQAKAKFTAYEDNTYVFKISMKAPGFYAGSPPVMNVNYDVYTPTGGLVFNEITQLTFDGNSMVSTNTIFMKKGYLIEAGIEMFYTGIINFTIEPGSYWELIDTVQPTDKTNFFKAVYSGLFTPTFDTSVANALTTAIQLLPGVFIKTGFPFDDDYSDERYYKKEKQKYKNKFECPLKCSDWETVKKDLLKKFYFANTQPTREAWLKRIDFNPNTTKSKISLTSWL